MKKGIVISWSVYSISPFETWLNNSGCIVWKQAGTGRQGFPLEVDVAKIQLGIYPPREISQNSGMLQNYSQFVRCQNDDYKRHRSEMLLFSRAVRTCNSVGATYINLYNAGIITWRDNVEAAIQW